MIKDGQHMQCSYLGNSRGPQSPNYPNSQNVNPQGMQKVCLAWYSQQARALRTLGLTGLKAVSWEPGEVSIWLYNTMLGTPLERKQRQGRGYTWCPDYQEALEVFQRKQENVRLASTLLSIHISTPAREIISEGTTEGPLLFYSFHVASYSRLGMENLPGSSILSFPVNWPLDHRV